MQQYVSFKSILIVYIFKTKSALKILCFLQYRNLHTSEVTKKAAYCSHIDYIIYYELNSLNYESIGQFEALNRRATEAEKQVLTFFCVNNFFSKSTKVDVIFVCVANSRDLSGLRHMKQSYFLYN